MYARYETIVDRFILKGPMVGAILGSLTGAYIQTDPGYGTPKLTHAFTGSIFGAVMGGITGAIIVIAHPVIAVTPLAVVPYMYNVYKMDTNHDNVKKLE